MKISSRVVLFLLVLSQTACYRSPCAPPLLFTPSEKGLEKSFTSVEGKFKIDMPPPQKTPTPESDGSIKYGWLIVNRGQFQVRYSDYENDLEHIHNTDGFFDRLRDLYLAKNPGQIENDQELSLSGHPGRALRIRREKFIELLRLYAVKNRLYWVTAVIPIKLECALADAEASVASFELVADN